MMSARDFLRTLPITAGPMFAAVLTILAGVLLARSGLGVTAEDVARLATPKYGWNDFVARTAAQQAAFSRCGVILLLVAGAVQLYLLVRGGNAGAGISQHFIGVGMAFIVAGFAWWIADCRVERDLTQARIINKRLLEQSQARAAERSKETPSE